MKQKTTAEQPVVRVREEIIKEAFRIEETTLFSSKGHYASAYNWSKFNLWLGIPLVVLSAIAGTTFISGYNICGAILSIIIATLSAIMTFLNPNDRSNNHLNAGNNYDSLHNQVRIFRTIDCWQESSEIVLTNKIKDFSDQKDKLNANSPQIPWWAYRKAKRGIEQGEGGYSIDKESKVEKDLQIPSSHKETSKEEAINK